MESIRWAFSYRAWAPCCEEWLLAMRLVQPEEKKRIEQFVFGRDAKAAMAGRLMIRKLIAERLKIPWNKIQLQRTSQGKPVLVNALSSSQSNFSFNVSHQGNYTVLAAEPDCQVGIDIMKTTMPGSGSIPDFFQLMKRQFTEEEWRVIKSRKNEWLQLDMFHRHWALKESFVKAIGVGIGFDLQRIEFNVSPVELEVGKTYNETIVLLDGEEEKEWTFEETRLDDCHHIAVALGKSGEFGKYHSGMIPSHKPAFTILTFNDLVTSAIPLASEDPACWESFCSRQEMPTRQSCTPR
ncbi:L-aminoadipate-semialdehyde dehydrogenase-phosphopantetheinyl transferase [Pseudonaja textilis]|nr:L-aminoadipate-semialdehyde dehydrogenase-phosphopantetheinyl transferase [Pseudonaja textilis]XP_026562701.1 L-aminoadipate-semialdehyde dehydrogenase-phosphopantetheinyl transferase [Pseudonaja textilis]XP_026562702.1 L-aminoadipate-semialdehyde dehydrogenase-phosphopantetheinyl transferase [Pseudonaja textilis]